MLSLYEILKASKTGLAPDMWTSLAGMNWSGADSGHEVKELTGIPPLSFRADGTPLLDWYIKGNMSQTGTPTPQNPIQPSECGDLETTGEHAGQYKIPISSANTTTPVYLGEVQSTRRIKKYEFTGQETGWNYSTSGGRTRAYIALSDSLGASLCVCSHYDYVASSIFYPDIDKFTLNATGSILIGLDSTIYTDVTAYKTYLQQQYAAGTPVTVWYVLATPETAVVNEPIRKIGDYADTISYEQAGVQIPTNRGNTVIDVETTLKPSEMYIKYQE